MKVQIKFTIEVNQDAYDEEYGPFPGGHEGYWELRRDVRARVANIVDLHLPELAATMSVWPKTPYEKPPHHTG